MIKNEFKKKIDDIYQTIHDLLTVDIHETNIKFAYDINNLFINFDKNNIREIIYDKYIDYQNQDKNLKLEELEDIILEKFSLCLPQDIIRLLYFQEYNSQYNNIKEKIILFYERGKNKNLFNFIETMEYEKNIIYTFTDINENILLKESKDISTKLLGKIKTINIKEIIINSFFSESDFMNKINEFDSDKNNKIIIIIKINPKYNHMKDYINIINNIIENNKNKNKAFIITFHVNGIFEEERKNMTIENDNIDIISNYNNYNKYKNFYQLFIDDLNCQDREKKEIKENLDINDVILDIFCSILKNSFNLYPKYILDIFEILKEKNKFYIDLIKVLNNQILDERILNIFENKINLYFEKISYLSEEDKKLYFPNCYSDNKIYIIFDKSLEMFKISINYLEEFYKNNKNIQENELLCKLFCISYIKIYLYKYINFIYKNEKSHNFDEIIKLIEGKENNNFRKIIKIYIFKIFFYLLNSNCRNFSNYDFYNNGIIFYNEFKEKIIEKEESILSYYIYQIIREMNIKNFLINLIILNLMILRVIPMILKSLSKKKE